MEYQLLLKNYKILILSYLWGGGGVLVPTLWGIADQTFDAWIWTQHQISGRQPPRHPRKIC